MRRATLVRFLASIAIVAVCVVPVRTQSPSTAEVRGKDGQEAGPPTTSLLDAPPASLLGAQPSNTQARVRSGKRTALGIALVAAGTAWLAIPAFTEPTPAQDTLQALREVGLLNEGISWLGLDDAFGFDSPLLSVYGGYPPVCWESTGAVYDACADAGVRGAVAATIEYEGMAAGRRLALGGWSRAIAVGLVGAGTLMSTLWAEVPVTITPTAGGGRVGVRRAVALPERLGRRLSVRAHGGWRMLRGGNINDTVAAFAQGWESHIRNEASTLPGGGGDVAATRRGREIGADVIVHVTPRIGLVGGIGWITSDSEGLLETPLEFTFFPILQSSELHVRAVPVRFGVQYTYPVGRRVGVTLEGGAGVYFSRLQWSHRLDTTSGFADWRTDASGHDLGGHGAVWLDVSVTDRIGLVVGVHAAHANIGGLSGIRSGRYTYQSETLDEGALRLVEDSIGFPFLVVGDGSWTTDRFGTLTPVGDARVGLGGFRVTSGLRIAFGGDQAGVQRAVASPERVGRRLSVRAHGGWRMFRGGNINDTVAAFAQRWESTIRTLPGGGGDVAATRRGREIGADVIVHVTPRIGLVGGIGWITSDSEGLLETPLEFTFFPILQSSELHVRAVPVRFGVQYTYPVGRRVGVTLEGGAGVYFSRLQWSHRLDTTSGFADWRTDASGHDLGGHGAVWLDVSVTDRIGLVVGVHAVRANIGGLSGIRAGRFTHQSETIETMDEGALRLVEDISGFPFLVLGDGSWMTDPTFRPAGDARVGLGGFRVTSGLRIAF